MAKIFIMSAASGAGKTTLKEMVLGDFPNFRYSISATSRAPRPGEVDGLHYFFHSRASFESMIEKNELVEYNEVHGNYYGTPKNYLENTLAKGHDILLDLDVFGKINFDKEYPEAIGILVLPPSLDILEERLRSRKTDSEQVIELRLQNARTEMEFAQQHGKYEYTLINDDLTKAAQELKAIFQQECGN